MSLGLSFCDGVTYRGLIPGENGFFLSWKPLIACSSSFQGGPLCEFTLACQLVLPVFRSCLGVHIVEISRVKL